MNPPNDKTPQQHNPDRELPIQLPAHLQKLLSDAKPVTPEDEARMMQLAAESDAELREARKLPPEAEAEAKPDPWGSFLSEQLYKWKNGEVDCGCRDMAILVRRIVADEQEKESAKARLLEAFQPAPALAEKPSPWLAIDSAPKDGTEFLGGWMFQKRWRQCVVKFAPNGSCVSFPGTWTYQPTHWQPLPATPEAGQ